jgi:hypothetical protein
MENSKFLKSKLFTDYINTVYNNTARYSQVDGKIIFYDYDSELTDYDKWYFYYDIKEENIHIIKDNRTISLEDFKNKISKLKIFL